VEEKPQENYKNQKQNKFLKEDCKKKTQSKKLKIRRKPWKTR